MPNAVSESGESKENRTEKNRTEICLSRLDELPASVEEPESKPDSSCSDRPSSTPTSANGKAPTNFSSEGIASGFQTTFEGPSARDGSKSASNELCARVEAKAEVMYQLGLELDDSPPTMESAC